MIIIAFLDSSSPDAPNRLTFAGYGTQAGPIYKKADVPRGKSTSPISWGKARIGIGGQSIRL